MGSVHEVSNQVQIGLGLYPHAEPFLGLGRIHLAHGRGPLPGPIGSGPSGFGSFDRVVNSTKRGFQLAGPAHSL